MRHLALTAGVVLLAAGAVLVAAPSAINGMTLLGWLVGLTGTAILCALSGAHNETGA